MSTPLASVGSIKVKLGVLVVVSVLVAMVVSLVGHDSGVPLLLAVPVTVALALGVTQLLAVGMTSPLREMTEAARRMAHGDYRGRVRAESADEVGELARAFNQMATELDTVDKEQRALVATVSHELRTPLAGLTAVLENLADGVVPPDEEHLEAAVGQARRLSDLVGDLLELSRVDAGVAPLRLADVDVAELLDETVAELVPTGRAVSFGVDVEGGLTVRADRARLRQLVVNLLDNAVRHGPERGMVRIRAGLHGKRWRLEIADDGPGVPPADRERAFERFGTLATDPSSAAGGGTGLGLAIARWVATLHGGTVRFVDPPAGTTGAVLRVDLPLDPPARQRDPAERRTTLRFVPTGGRHDRLHHRGHHTQAAGADQRGRHATRDRPAVRQALARRHWLGPAGGPGGARSRRAGGPAHPVPRPRPRVLPGAPRGRRDGVVGRQAPHRPVHGRLPDPGGPVHAARRAAGRRVDRGPVPVGRHGSPGRRGDTWTPPGGVRGRRVRLAAVRAAGAALAGPEPARRPRLGPRASCAADRAVVGGCGARVRPPVRIRRRGRGRVARRDRARPHRHLLRAARLHRCVHRRRDARGGVPRPQPARRLGCPRASGLAGGAPVRVAGAGPARGPGLRRVRGRAGGRAVRRPRLRAAHHRAHVRRVRAPGLRPAHRRHPADVPRGLGRLPPSRHRPGRRPLAPHLPRAALRADPGRGRLSPAPDAAVPGGVRVHPGAPGRRRVRGLARDRGARGGPLGRGPVGHLGAPVRARHGRRRVCSASPPSTPTT